MHCKLEENSTVSVHRLISTGTDTLQRFSVKEVDPRDAKMWRDSNDPNC